MCINRLNETNNASQFLDVISMPRPAEPTEIRKTTEDPRQSTNLLPNVFALQAHSITTTATKYPKLFPKLTDIPHILEPDFIDIGEFDGRLRHMAIYEKGEVFKKKLAIMTIIEDPTGIFENQFQMIIYNEKNVSKSNTWLIEQINGIQFIKYIHDDFYVFTNDHTQFFIKI